MRENRIENIIENINNGIASGKEKAKSATSKGINIILDESVPPHVKFVEINNDEGASIRIGMRSETEHGLTSIRITAEDIEEAIGQVRPARS